MGKVITLCFCAFAGFSLIFQFFDSFRETDRIDATVYDAYYSSGYYYRLEWYDLNGKRCSEQIEGKNDLSVGDTLEIIVDAETHSRRMYSTAGYIFSLILGLPLFIIPIYSLIKHLIRPSKRIK